MDEFWARERQAHVVETPRLWVRWTCGTVDKIVNFESVSSSVIKRIYLAGCSEG